MSPPATDRIYANTAQLVLPTQDIEADLAFFETTGFRLTEIFPADDPAVAILQGHGLTLRLDRRCQTRAGRIRLPATAAPLTAQTSTIVAPNGTRIEFGCDDQEQESEFAPTQRHWSIRHLDDSGKWSIGRAGMLYRDLVPCRLGGRVIASHIRIPNGGPVPDRVHYHKVDFQLIYCLRGWVDVVYEDQGPAIRLTPGDCFTQPPEIRHRVLTASDNLEVIEIGAPEKHVTRFDYELELPTTQHEPDRAFSKQRFCHHRSADATWKPLAIDTVSGFEICNTEVQERSASAASVHRMRVSKPGATLRAKHTGQILIQYVLSGSASVRFGNATTMSSQPSDPQHLSTGSTFVVPTDGHFSLTSCSPDFEWLLIALPGGLSLQAS